MFEKFELIIGDTVVETLYPEMINICENFSNIFKVRDQHILLEPRKLMTHQQFTNMGNTVSEQGNRYYYIPLPFYFYGNTTQSLPLCAITQQEVIVRCYMKSIYDIILFTTYDPIIERVINAVKLLEFNFDVEYIYLSPQEFKFFTTNELHYTITQTQQQFETVTPVQNQEHYTSLDLRFVNQIVEMFFYVLPERVFSTDLTANGRMNFVDKNDSGTQVQERTTAY